MNHNFLDSIRVCAIGQVLLLAWIWFRPLDTIKGSPWSAGARAVAWWIHTIALGVLLVALMKLGLWVFSIGLIPAILFSVLWLVRLPLTSWMLRSAEPEWRLTHQALETTATIVIVATAFVVIP